MVEPGSIPPAGPGRVRSRFVAHARLAPLALVMGGCVEVEAQRGVIAPQPNAAFTAMYGARPDERFALPATDIADVDPRYFRQEVAYLRSEPPGTLVVDPGNKFLYLVRENGRALRYGVGVGRAGLAWSGSARVGRKAEWPRWTPTADMIAREPERNAPWRNGMAGGLGNPLGPRALYLFDGPRDTLYRIHGTTEPRTIGTNVSSGCIRMFNQDIIDLYGRVPVETRVVVLPAGEHVEPPEVLSTASAPMARADEPLLAQVSGAAPGRY
ncbi:L,D-transpeptidase [Methylobacterium tardum]|uniref:L,D-transpeptidase n=1 Tax=Methylobacterium tardum TaxID=374432 RepID=UPI00202211E3|nr:L,D-transpeptidase [Methylobacterium tardum]URD35093.1 L,D-transpeptidase [Methylobacterium tardum]